MFFKLALISSGTPIISIVKKQQLILCNQYIYSRLQSIDPAAKTGICGSPLDGVNARRNNDVGGKIQRARILRQYPPRSMHYTQTVRGTPTIYCTYHETRRFYMKHPYMCIRKEAFGSLCGRRNRQRGKHYISPARRGLTLLLLFLLRSSADI